MGGYESFVYEYQKNNAFFILKISHAIRRSRNNIRGEIEFLNFLSNKGLAVSNAVPSTRGNMVEEIAAENGSFLAISYEMSLGKELSDKDWNESLYEKWGEFLGKIHHATKGYHLRSGGDTSPPKFVVPPDYFTGKQECGIEVGENYNLAKVRGCEATELPKLMVELTDLYLIKK